MHPLSPPPPYTPATLKQTKSSPLYQIGSSNQAKNHQDLSPEALPYSRKLRTRKQPILRQPLRTNPIVWCGAVLCLLFSVHLIFFGIATLIIFVAIRPRNPVLTLQRESDSKPSSSTIQSESWRSTLLIGPFAIKLGTSAAKPVHGTSKAGAEKHSCLQHKRNFQS